MTGEIARFLFDLVLDLFIFDILTVGTYWNVTLTLELVSARLDW